MASTVWRGYITFGLISIPVRLFRAARAERVSLRRLYRSEAPVQAPSRGRLREFAELAEREPELAPVRQASVRKETGEILPEQSVVKGYEYEKKPLRCPRT